MRGHWASKKLWNNESAHVVFGHLSEKTIQAATIETAIILGSRHGRE